MYPRFEALSNSIENVESNKGLFQHLSSFLMLKILQYLSLKSVASIRQCSHFFSDNYYLSLLLEKAQFEYYSQKELKTIFTIKLQRLLSLTADFSKTQQELIFSDLPCSTLSPLSPTILSLIYDHGRANSFLADQQYNISFFIGDDYHREANLHEPILFSLVEIACVLSTECPSTKLIIIEPSQVDLVRLNLLRDGLDLSKRLVYFNLLHPDFKQKKKCHY